MFLKKYLWAFMGLAFSSGLHAQHNFEWYSNGATVYTAPGSVVSVQGDVHLMGNSSFTHNGLLKSQGNLYSSNTMQQRGTGTVRLENDAVNSTETQFIQGSYAVRGVQAATGVDDGSFYNLELANSQGIVWLNGSGNVADVRGAVNFGAGAVLNRIVTANPMAVPANGAAYPAVFGMMNASAGSGNFMNNTADLNGNMSTMDVAYVQGKLRRAIDAAGGVYGYYLGLEPAGAGAQRGFQYIHLDFAANNYDVVEGYFQTGSPNAVAGSLLECSGYQMDYFGGADHGEWIFEDLTGAGTGTYAVQVWPQDDNFPAKTIWLISKDDAFMGTANQCGGSPVALQRGGFSGFSEFGVVGSEILLGLEFLNMQVRAVDNRLLRVDWILSQEEGVQVYELERSQNGQSFESLGQVAWARNSSQDESYAYEDLQVLPGVDYYYRVKALMQDGSFMYSAVAQGRLQGEQQATPQVTLFPNPKAQGQIGQLLVQTPMAESGQIEVYDALGRLLHQQRVELQEGSNLFELPSQNWAKGVYTLRLQTETWQSVRPWILE